MSYTPEKLLYVSRPEITVTNHFGQAWKRQDQEKTSRDVFPTFVVDAENPKTRATAIAWAERRYYNDPIVTPRIVEVPNAPLTSVELVTLEYRGEGGRAWKVIVEGSYYVDLREDTLLDVLLYGAGHEQGIIYGPFIWACIGSSIKLITFGGHEHSKIVEEEKSPSGRRLADKRRNAWKKASP